MSGGRNRSSSGSVAAFDDYFGLGFKLDAHSCSEFEKCFFERVLLISTSLRLVPIRCEVLLFFS